MTDLGHDLRFGAFLTPAAEGHERLLALAELADRIGLDLIGIQDHPYQPAFLDTWTLLSHLSARTTRVALVPDVINLPLRPPSVLARSAASLDILSGGRVELGLGSGAFWDGVAAMGGERRTPGEAVEALEEAIGVLRALWTPGRGVRISGEHYELRGAKPGPFPVHPIGLWIGSYKPRMLELTGRLGDGWLPSSAYADPEQLAAMTERLDSAAVDAGRDAADVRRVYNITGRFGRRAGTGFLDGPPSLWAEQLTDLALRLGVSGFVLAPGGDPEGDLRTFAEEVAPAVRAAVERERTGPAPAAGGTAPTGTAAEPAAEQSDGGAASIVGPDGSFDDASRPRLEKRDPAELTAAQRASGQRLVQIHDHLRGELKQIRDAVDQVASGQRDPAAARDLINRLTMRQNYWTLGSFCASYCRLVTTHHTIENVHMFPRLSGAQESLGPVVARLEAEHEVIADVLTGIDTALVAMVTEPGALEQVREQVELLDDVLLSHLDYEEEELVEPLGRLEIDL
ncbi:hemerythrin HHE cation binding domain-containing protein [Murinocardiopsis flavida]|uniref:Hemerythrin HHE cation binding domain-containing protein n=1 Tax=Murinocardiopsis flavida TaxID=645275 RepID=A0A2P8CEZ3_9ACTN|nr:LLM class flavin-dependent oxidoreductase [Murinocardiopsis flavida]PSK83560.1 hemerythrin HHE cation binding domain-containing protein [Murinocardiopsis flavida]